jgi:hypothetical protein
MIAETSGLTERPPSFSLVEGKALESSEARLDLRGLSGRELGEEGGKGNAERG